MASPNPACTVQDGGGAVQTVPPFTATAGNVITIALANTAGVNTWTLTLFGQDDVVTPPTVTVNPATKTATFTAPAAPWSLVYQSQVNAGHDVNGAGQASYTTTVEVHAKTAGGLYLCASNETLEFSPTTGWIAKINQILRSASGTTTSGTGFWHNTAGGLDAAARAINLASADVTGVLATANGGTGLSTVGTNGQVLTVVGGVPAWANASVTVTGSGFLHNTSGTLDAAASKGTAGQFALTNSGATDIAWTTLTQDVSASTSTVGQITVTGIQTKAVPAPTGTNTVLQWSGSAFSWATVGGGSSVTWASDLINSTNTNQWVASISGSGGTGGTVALNINTLQWAAGQTSPTFNQNSTASATGQNFTIGSQASTATNGTPGNLILNVPAPTGTGTSGFVVFANAGTNVGGIGSFAGGALYLGVNPTSANAGNYVVASNGSNTYVNAPGGAGSINFRVANGGTDICSADPSGFYTGNPGLNGGGTTVIGIAQVTALPTSAPTNGIVAYANTGSPGSLGLFSTGIQFHRLAGTITVGIDTPTTDVIARNLNLIGQSALASASTNRIGGDVHITPGAGATTNGTGGNVLLQLQAPTGTGTEATVQITRTGTTYAQWQAAASSTELHWLGAAAAPAAGNFVLAGDTNTFAQINAASGGTLWLTVNGVANGAGSDTSPVLKTGNGVQFFNNTPQFGGGIGVIGITSAGANPTSAPTGGGVLYGTVGGGGTIFITGTLTHFSAGGVICEFAPNGAGTQNSQTNNILRRFYRLRTATTSVTPVVTYTMANSTSMLFLVRANGRTSSGGLVEGAFFVGQAACSNTSVVTIQTGSVGGNLITFAQNPTVSLTASTNTVTVNITPGNAGTTDWQFEVDIDYC